MMRWTSCCLLRPQIEFANHLLTYDVFLHLAGYCHWKVTHEANVLRYLVMSDLRRRRVGLSYRRGNRRKSRRAAPPVRPSLVDH